MSLKNNNSNPFEPLTLPGGFAETFFKEHAEYTNEELIRMYGRPMLTVMYLWREAHRSDVYPPLFMFDKIIEAIDNNGPQDLLELRKHALPIAIEEFCQYRNLQPLSDMIERKLPEAIGNDYVIKIITGKLRDDMSNFFPETRGKRTSQKRYKTNRDDVIVALIYYYKGLGMPVWSSPDSLTTKENACELVAQKLEEMGFEPLNAESVYQYVWKKRKHEHERLFQLIHEAGQNDAL